MSTPPDKPAPPPAPAAGVSWETIDRVARDAERQRLETASDAQIEQELRDAGVDPAEADRIFDAAVAEADRRSAESGAAGADAARDKSSEAGGAALRGRWAVVLVAAAAVLLLLLAWKRREVVAFLEGSPEPIGPDRELVPEPDHVQHGQWVRRQALEACSMERWDDCRQRLDEAKRLDPAGESDPDVVKARKDIAAATALPEEQGDARLK